MADYRSFTDLELTGLLKSGDHAAFTEIYNRYWPLLFIHARNMLRDDDEATDIVQEIFTILWKKSDELELTASIRAYLYASTRHLTINQINKSKLKGRYLSSLAKMIEQGEAVTDDQVICNELIERIEKGIAELPKKMREVFELSRKEGLSQKDIAQVLNMKDEAVKKSIHRALKVLKTQVSGLFFTFFW